MQKIVGANKDCIEMKKAVPKIATFLIILKMLSEKNKNKTEMSYVDSLVDKISKEFKKIANKF